MGGSQSSVSSSKKRVSSAKHRSRSKSGGHHSRHHGHGHHSNGRHRTSSTQPEEPRDLSETLDKLMDGERSTLLLADMDLRDRDIPQVCKRLRDNTTVKELDLANNFLTDAVLDMCLLDTLLHNTTICSLRIAGNHFSVDGVRTLRAFLSCRGALIAARKKDTTQVELRALGINSSCGVLLKDFLSSYQKVVSLNLHENQLKADGVQMLCEGLIRSTSIRALILYGSEMGAWGAFHLAKALPLTGITKINLYKCYLEDNGATIIADSFSVAPSLQSVLLGYNLIHDEGAESLAKALAENDNIRELDLYSNQIGDNGVVALGKSLRTNRGLRFLLLAKNRFGAKGVKELADASAENYQMQAIDLGLDSKVREQCSEHISALDSHLEENRTSYEHRKRLRKFSKSLLRRSLSSGGLQSQGNQSPILHHNPQPQTPTYPLHSGASRSGTSDEGDGNLNAMAIPESPMYEMRSGMRGSMVLPKRLMLMLHDAVAEQELANGNANGVGTDDPNSEREGTTPPSASIESLLMSKSHQNLTGSMPRHQTMMSRSRASSERRVRPPMALSQAQMGNGSGDRSVIARNIRNQSRLSRTVSDPNVPLTLKIGSPPSHFNPNNNGNGNTSMPMTPPRAPTYSPSSQSQSPTRTPGKGKNKGKNGNRAVKQFGFSPPSSPGTGTPTTTVSNKNP